MAADSNAVEQAVSRTLRDNLGKIQRTAEELNQAVNDLVSACASSRPSNALPPMVRAQTSAASLSATLEVLSRFVTSALQPPMRSPYQQELSHAPSAAATAPSAPFADPVSEPVAEPDANAVVDRVVDDGMDHAPADVVTYAEQLESAPPHQTEEIEWTPPAPALARAEESPAAEVHASAEASAVSDVHPPFEMPPESEIVGSFTPAVEAAFFSEPVPVFVHDVVPAVADIDAPVAPRKAEPVETAHAFSLDSLPPDEQELHRRAYRIAKVSMQDMKMLRPEDVRLGRENKDLCFRLRDDIEKAHKEYDRRFQSIQSHPVDYFYDWMVEILAGGDSRALGEYPYPSPLVRR